ncbi:MAG: 5-formyltetrahydrofolate cyclo-ligase [Micavibrio sp.]|jgi:5-formyltetrahydrofolate cyclo-ligase|nr:MAG: 5-formyltetrahydrofolate cyclo-ligase [Micavibrio sp.]
MEAQQQMPASDKKSIRDEFLEERRKISPVVEQHYAAEIASKVINNFDFKNKVVAGYWPVHGEADIRPALMHLSSAGHICALPVIAREDAPLIFRRWTSTVKMAQGAHGIPVPDKNDPVAEVVDPDILLVPLVAYDRRGMRIGYGAGYYDRTIADLRARKTVQTVGIAFSVQKSMELLPAEPHDMPLDYVVTERMVDRF